MHEVPLLWLLLSFQSCKFTATAIRMCVKASLHMHLRILYIYKHHALLKHTSALERQDCVLCTPAEGFENLLQAQLHKYAGQEEAETIAFTGTHSSVAPPCAEGLQLIPQAQLQTCAGLQEIQTLSTAAPSHSCLIACIPTGRHAASSTADICRPGGVCIHTVSTEHILLFHC